MLGLSKDASPAEIKKTYFSVCLSRLASRTPCSLRASSLPGNTIPIRILTRVHKTNLSRSNKRTTYDAPHRLVHSQFSISLQILKDDKKRALYDRYGPASQQPGFDPDAFANARGPFGAGTASGGFQDFSHIFGAGAGRSHGDLFEQLFGAFGGRTRGAGFAESSRGADLEATVTVNFLDACKGTTRNVNISPVVDCKACSGSGLRAGSKRSTCGDCGGSGTRTFVIDSGFQMASTCNRCSGTGTTIPRGSQCVDCGGVGKVRTRKTVQVTIPPGTPPLVADGCGELDALMDRCGRWHDHPGAQRGRRVDIRERKRG